MPMSSVTLQYVDQAQQATETDTVRVEELEQIVDTAEGVLPANQVLASRRKMVK